MMRRWQSGSARDYGKEPGRGEDMVHLGLSARMSECHAAVGCLRNIDLSGQSPPATDCLLPPAPGSLPGCWVQDFPEDRSSSGNYFVLFITEQARRSRDEVYTALQAAGIQTKRYFYPPVHTQTIFQAFPIRVSARRIRYGPATRPGTAIYST